MCESYASTYDIISNWRFEESLVLIITEHLPLCANGMLQSDVMAAVPVGSGDFLSLALRVVIPEQAEAFERPRR